jgi:hypothetical protein
VFGRYGAAALALLRLTALLGRPTLTLQELLEQGYIREIVR